MLFGYSYSLVFTGGEDNINHERAEGARRAPSRLWLSGPGTCRGLIFITTTGGACRRPSGTDRGYAAAGLNFSRCQIY